MARRTLEQVLALSLALPLASAASQAPASRSGRAAPVPGAVGRAPRAEALIDVEQYRLPNGLRVVLAHDSTTPYVAVETWYASGSREDPPAKRGRAHLFEHTFTARRFFTNPANAPLRSRVLNSNAQVRRDYTRYYLETRAEDLALALALHADRMDTPDSTITPALVAQNVDIVVNEGRQGSVASLEDGPSSFFLLNQAFFPAGHPYAMGAETEGTLRAITAEDLRALRSLRYGPENALLLVVGRFDRERARADIARHFGGIAPRAAPGGVRPRGVAEPTVARLERTTGRVARPVVWRRWATPWYGHPDTDLLQLAVIALARPRVGPLAVALRAGAPGAGTPVWFVEPSELAGDVQLQLTAGSMAELPAVHAAIDAAVSRLAASGPDAGDLAWAKREWEQRLLAMLEPLGFQRSRAETLGEGALFAGDAEAYRDRLGRVREASAAQVARAARDWLHGGYALELVPRDSLATLATADPAAALALGSPAVVALPPVREVAVPGRASLIVAPRAAHPLVRVSLVIPAAPGVRHAALHELLARELSRRLERAELGQVTRISSPDEFTVGVTARPADLGAVLDAVARLAAAPVDSAWRADRDAMVASFAVPDNELLRRFAFELARSWPLADSASAIQALRALEDTTIARAIGAALARPGTRLVIAGGVRESDAIAMGRAALARWPATQPQDRIGFGSSHPGAPPRAVYVRHVPGRSQVRVAAVLALPKEATDVTAALLERDLQARVNQRLRVERQWSYGAASTTFGPLGAQGVIVWAEVQADRAADAVVEVERVVAEYRDATTAVDTGVVSDALRQGVIRRMQTLGGVESVMRDLVVTYGSADSLAARDARLRALGAADVRSARAAADPGALLFVLTGDAGAIDAQLTRAGRPRALPATP